MALYGTPPSSSTYSGSLEEGNASGFGVQSFDRQPLLANSSEPPTVAADNYTKHVAINADEEEEENIPIIFEDEEEVGPMKRSLSAVQLAFITYFFTTGGPFGIEAAVGAAGAFYSLLAVLLVPLFWSLPQALMAAELALMMDENGGNVVWVQKAFGDFLGWLNAWNNVLQNFSSSALYAVIFLEYLPYDFSFWEGWAAKIAFTMAIMCLNLWGVKWVSRLSGVLLVLVLLPFLAEAGVGIALGRLDITRDLERMPFGDIQWALFISTVIWNVDGIDAMGSVAAEVSGGRSTYIRGITAALFLNTLNYFVPILIGYPMLPHPAEWVNGGCFTHIAFSLFEWLGIWMVAASVISNFGQMNAYIAALSRTVWAMGHGVPVEMPSGKIRRTRQLPKLLACFRRSQSGTVRPVLAIVVTGMIVALLSGLPFDFLVQVFLLLRTVNLACEFGAWIRLKYKVPEASKRPFEAPGGKVGAILLSIPPALISLVVLVESRWQVLAAGGLVNGIVILAYVVKTLVNWCCTRRQQDGYVLIVGTDDAVLSK